MNVLQTRTLSQMRRVEDAVIKDFAESLILDDGSWIRMGGGVFKLNPENNQIPPWNFVIHYQRDDRHFFLVDTRPFENRNRITKTMEYDLMMRRAHAFRRWHMDPSGYMNIQAPVTAVYMEWIGSLIKSRYNIDEVQMETLKLFLGFYVFSVIQAHVQKNNELDTILTSYERFLTMKLRRPRQIVERIFNPGVKEKLMEFSRTQLGESGQISPGYLEAIIQLAVLTIDSPALQINVGAILNLAATSWMGHDSATLSLVAVEHPVILSCLVSVAVESSLYRKTRIGQATDTVKRMRLDPESVQRFIGTAVGDGGMVESQVPSEYPSRPAGY
jgi:hypothetical protein